MRAVEPDSPQRPWYREPWPWFLMALPAAAIVAGIFTMVLAFRTEDGLIADDYYRQGLAINRVLRRDERARELNLSANATFSGTRLRVALQGQAPPGLRLRLIHPVRAGGDRSVVLRSVAPGVYEGSFVPTAGQSWRLLLEDAASTWRLSGRWNGRDPSVSLAAPR